MNLSVILPILNEEEVIKQTIDSVHTKVGKYVENLEVIAVNDGSTDTTLQVLTKLQKKYPSLKIVNHKTNKGYGAALKSGLSTSKYTWIFFTDSDMQFDYSNIKDFIPYTKKYDFIVGYRVNRADANRRKFVSHIYNRIIKLIFGLPLRDVDCAFKLMNKKAVANIEHIPDSFFVSAELMIRSLRKGYVMKEIGVEHLPRKKGVSKVTLRQVIRTINDLINLYKTM